MVTDINGVSIVLRNVDKLDHAFIYATWLKSFRRANLVRNVSDTIYFKFHHKLIELALSSGKTTVACLQESPDVVMGYINHSEDSINYVYVKNNFRRFGIGKLLLGSTNGQKYYTHLTDQSKYITKGLDYNPYLL